MWWPRSSYRTFLSLWQIFLGTFPITAHISFPRQNHCSGFYQHRWLLQEFEHSINEIPLLVVFCIWLLSLIIISMRFIHVFACNSSWYFLLFVVFRCFKYTTADCLVNGCLSSLQNLAIMNKPEYSQMYFLVDMCSFLLGICLEEELLDHKA